MSSVPPPPATLQTEYQPQWSTWVRQFVSVLLVIGIIYGLSLLGPVIQILLISFLVAILMYFPCSFVARRTRIHYKLAVGLLYILLIVVFIGAIVTLIPVATSGIQSLTRSINQAYADLQVVLRDYTPAQGIVDLFGTKVDLNAIIESIRNVILGTGNGQPITPNASVVGGIDFGPLVSFVTASLGSLLTGVTGFVSTAFLALFLSFLILFELPNYRRALLKEIPPVHHREIGLLLSRVLGVWRGFFRGQLTVGLIIGILTWGQLTLMGAQNALLLALIVAFISLIPNIGGIIALVPLGLLPLLQGSTVFKEMQNGTFALLVVGVNLILTQIIWNVVAPAIMGDVLELPLPVIIIGVFIGAAIGGILGAFLIAPLMGTLRIIVSYLIHKITLQDPFHGEQFTESALR